MIGLTCCFLMIGVVVGMLGWSSRRVELGRTPAGLARALRQHPGNVGLYVSYGRALLSEGNLERASGAFSGALLLQPDLSEARLALSQIMIAQGRLSTAERHLDAVLRRKPASVEARLLLAQVYTARRQFPAAAKLLSQESADRSNARLLVALGEANSRMDEWEGAEAAFRAALKLNPRLARANSGLGQVLAHKGDIEGATRLFEKACALAPNDPATWHAAGYHHLQAGSAAGFESAVQAFHRELSLTPDTAQTFYLLGMAENRLGKTREAVATLETAAQLDPGERSVAFEQAKAYETLGDKPRASAARARFTRLLSLQTEEEKLRRQMSASPPTAGAFRRIASLLMAQGRTAQALWELEQGMRHFPNDDGLRSQAAPLLSALGRTSEAPGAGPRTLGTGSP